MDSLGDYAVGNFDWMEFTSASSGAGDTFRMMTWNIDQGFSNDDQTFRTLPYQIGYMANSGADVIVLQEVSVWDEDQPALYRTGLEQATGQTWYSVWAPGGDCMTGGGCIGVQILTRFPIAASQSIFIPVGDDRSSVAQALIYVAGVPINIFTNHLEYWDTGIRTAELYGLMGFAQALGGARLVAGDFNSWWDEWWIHQMETEYSDTKVDITQNQDGDYTTGNVRFDYIFRSYEQAWRLTPLTCMVGWDADWMSDHRPVIADFRVQ
jgi:endonuclease/exonuclease/phosphatase family metal-dependent hydrolase